MSRSFRLLTATFLASAAFAAAAVANDYVMLKVNNDNITAAEVDGSWKTLFPEEGTPSFADVDEKIRQNVLRGMASERLLYAEAVKQGVDKSEDVQRQLEELRKKVIVKNFLEAKTADMVKESDLKAEYDKVTAQLKGKEEARARHILVASEEEAKKIAERIAKGEAFEKVAGEVSKDPGSAKQGGDLGYFTEDKMVPEFAKAAFALKKGEVSKPVKSQFGWHVIKLEDKRKVAPPTYSEVKPQLKAMLQEKALSTYVEQLLNKSTVKYYDAKGKEIPFEKVPKK